MTRTEQILRDVAQKNLKPRPKISLVTWADNFRRLSRESAAEPGRWYTSRVPYMREPMEAITTDGVEVVILKISSQLGKTELLLNTIGFYAHYDPKPILLLQPTEAAAVSFNKERIAPMIRDTPAITELFKSDSYGDSANTILYKAFPGGFVASAGSNSPTALAGRPIAITLLDEVCRFPFSAKTEGDPVQIVRRRSQNFHDSKFIAVSTPTVEGASKISELFLDTDQCYYHIECIHCKELFYPEWKHVTWNEPEDAMIVCPSCGGLHNDNERLVASSNGKYIARNPGHRNKGFHTNILVSPWIKLKNVVHEFIACDNEPAKLQPFWNTCLGLEYKYQGQEVGDISISSRGIEYDHLSIPNDVIILTCGCDVQNDRVEYEVLGHTSEGQTYSIYYGVVPGDTRDLDTFAQFKDELLTRKYIRQDGIQLDVSVTLIDSGYQTKNVYKFCDLSKKEKIYASKGIAGPKAMITLSKSPYGATFYRVAVDIFKEQLYNNLQLTDTSKAGYSYFPIDRGQDYFVQLCQSETRTSTVDKRGQRFWHYEKKSKNDPNEALDCRVYAMAAFEIIRPVAKKNAEYNIRKQLLQVKEPIIIEKEVKSEPIQNPINSFNVIPKASKYSNWGNLKTN